MSKHTPAPWEAGSCQIGAPLPFTPIMANTLVAKVYSTAFGDYDQSEANARLMAAAPELLEALKAILEVPKNTMSNGKALAETLKIARTAITKAEGQS